jgi:predicted nucleotidyltransferase
MYQHHKETIKNVTERFIKNNEVLGLIISGSLAHGFAKEDSDVDIMIVIPEEQYKIRLKSGELTYVDKEDCTYADGYVDGKYISVDFMNKIAAMGSEPARYAFQGSIVAFSKISELENIIKSITQYPIELKQDKIKRFYAQFQAWNWYCHEAIKKENSYLLNYSVSKLILFGGRLILAYNETLYPYHKWFLNVLKNVKNKPDNFIQSINDLLESKNQEKIEAFYKNVVEFTDWGTSEINWPNLFALDSELNWLDGKIPIEDV